MRVENQTGHAVFVEGHGEVPAGESVTVRDSPQVKQLIQDGVFREKPSTSKKGGDSK